LCAQESTSRGCRTFRNPDNNADTKSLNPAQCKSTCRAGSTGNWASRIRLTDGAIIMQTILSKRPARSFGKHRKTFRLQGFISRVARKLWRGKHAAELAFHANVEERTAEYWLAGDTQPSAHHLTNLLRSEVGFAVLAELMAESGADWWRDLALKHDVAQLDRRAADNWRDIRRISRDLEAEEMRKCGSLQRCA
jgi:hypothetical protein